LKDLSELKILNIENNGIGKPRKSRLMLEILEYLVW